MTFKNNKLQKILSTNESLIITKIGIISDLFVFFRDHLFAPSGPGYGSHVCFTPRLKVTSNSHNNKLHILI